MLVFLPYSESCSFSCRCWDQTGLWACYLPGILPLVNIGVLNWWMVDCWQWRLFLHYCLLYILCYCARYNVSSYHTYWTVLGTIIPGICYCLSYILCAWYYVCHSPMCTPSFVCCVHFSTCCVLRIGTRRKWTRTTPRRLPRRRRKTRMTKKRTRRRVTKSRIRVSATPFLHVDLHAHDVCHVVARSPPRFVPLRRLTGLVSHPARSAATGFFIAFQATQCRFLSRELAVWTQNQWN